MTKLAKLTILVEILTAIVFSIAFPIASKLKGMLLSTAIISGLSIIGYISNILQPIIYKSKISFSKLTTIVNTIDLLWTINMIYFIYSHNKLLFIYSHIILNVALSTIYTSLQFKVEHKIAKVEHFESYKSTLSFIMGVSGIISAITATILFKSFNDISLLPIAIISNVMVMIINILIKNEYERL